MRFLWVYTVIAKKSISFGIIRILLNYRSTQNLFKITGKYWVWVSELKSFAYYSLEGAKNYAGHNAT